MLFLLCRQITTSRTPAGISRLSRWTFFAQALVDTITLVIVGVPGSIQFTVSPLKPKLISLAITVNPRACVPLIAPAALAAVLLVYEMVNYYAHGSGFFCC